MLEIEATFGFALSFGTTPASVQKLFLTPPWEFGGPYVVLEIQPGSTVQNKWLNPVLSPHLWWHHFKAHKNTKEKFSLFLGFLSSVRGPPGLCPVILSATKFLLYGRQVSSLLFSLQPRNQAFEQMCVFRFGITNSYISDNSGITHSGLSWVF